MSRGLLLLIIILVQSLPLSARQDTTSVFFLFNQSTLTDEARDALDAAMYSGRLSATRPLQIIGYADAVGGNAYNLSLSLRRAEAIKEYLLLSGFRAALIQLIVGKGEAGAARERPGGNGPDRRVDIVTSAGTKKTSGDTVIRFTLAPKAQISVAPKPIPTGPMRASSVDISQVPAGATLILDNIYFHAGRHYVRSESYPALDALVATLKEHSDIKIRIEGHVCCVPASAIDAMDDDTHREELSVNRADVVRSYLVRHGIEPARLSYTGFGHRKPLVAPEHNEEEANQNRRVEIRVMP